MIFSSYSVFASTVQFSNIPSYEGHTYSFTYYDSVNNKYATVLSSEKIYVDSSLSLRGGTKMRYFSTDGKNWSHYDSASVGTPYNFSNSGVMFTPYLSNHDILHNGTVFFSKPKGLLQSIQEIQIMEKMTHPIRGILPFLIPFLVLLVAFWKGWQFLSQQLRTA